MATDPKVTIRAVESSDTAGKGAGDISRTRKSVVSRQGPSPMRTIGNWRLPPSGSRCSRDAGRPRSARFAGLTTEKATCSCTTARSGRGPCGCPVPPETFSMASIATARASSGHDGQTGRDAGTGRFDSEARSVPKRICRTSVSTTSTTGMPRSRSATVRASSQFVPGAGKSGYGIPFAVNLGLKMCACTTFVTGLRAMPSPDCVRSSASGCRTALAGVQPAARRPFRLD